MMPIAAIILLEKGKVADCDKEDWEEEVLWWWIRYRNILLLYCTVCTYLYDFFCLLGGLLLEDNNCININHPRARRY
jgi:hypothetical protein